MTLVINKGDKFGRLTVIKEIQQIGINRRFLLQCS
jgi:hypothetical protein